MRKFLVGALLVAAVAAPAAAQESVTGAGKPSVFTISPYVGYVNYGNWFKTSNDVKYTNKNGALYGAQASFDLGRVVSIGGNFGYSRTRWQFQRDATGTANDVNIDLNKVGVWLYDGDITLKVPYNLGMTSLAPFVQGGIGGMRFTLDDNNFSTQNRSSKVAYNYGLGTDVKFGGGGVRLMAKDYISSFGWNKPSDTSSLNDIQNSNRAHSWVFSLGLNVGI